MRLFMVNLVETAIRAVLFAIPVAFVADWCGVQATWKTAAFVAFCIIWSDFVSGSSSASAEQKAPSEVGKQSDFRKPNPPAFVMTPTQVAAEARKLTPKPGR